MSFQSTVLPMIAQQQMMTAVLIIPKPLYPLTLNPKFLQCIQGIHIDFERLAALTSPSLQVMRSRSNKPSYLVLKTTFQTPTSRRAVKEVRGEEGESGRVRAEKLGGASHCRAGPCRLSG